MGKKDELLRLLDFILNRAGTKDIEVIQEALKRRIGDLSRRMTTIDVPDVAQQLSESIRKELSNVKDFYGRIREYMKGIIKQYQPDIPDENLDLLLDEWTPDPKWGEKGQEHKFPQDVIQSMIVQFIDYSLGRMEEKDERELPKGWSARYWEIFSGRTRSYITDLLTGKIDEELFWERVMNPEE